MHFRIFRQLVDGDDSSWVQTGRFSNFLAVECFGGPHEIFIQSWILCLLWCWRQMTSAWFSWAKLMTSRFLVCEYCPSSTKTRESSFVVFVYLINEENIGKKSRSASTPRDGTRGLIQTMAIHQFLFHIFSWKYNNGGMKCPVGPIKLTTVTRDPSSADWRVEIWRLSFNPNIFLRFCCIIVILVSS